MHLTYRNVNQAFDDLVRGIDSGRIPTVQRSSRVGNVLMVEEPVLITYTHPRERVLFNQARDCNPFFHLFESLWMLAGRSDVAPLAYYNSYIPVIASDDGLVFNAAYGHRWRMHRMWEYSIRDHADRAVPEGTAFCAPVYTDQIKVIIDQLKQKPDCRRCVLQIWDVEFDLRKINATKDVACNTHVYFSIRDVITDPFPTSDAMLDARPLEKRRYLDMTVCNRSNDLVWGMLGANVVHFSFLQEYMAACIGVEVGLYHQFTNNLHVYTYNWEPEKWLVPADLLLSYRDGLTACIGTSEDSMVPLVQDPDVFDREVVVFVDDIGGVFREPFLERVARPMCAAFGYHKMRKYRDALLYMESVVADDWRAAGRDWLLKRQRNWEEKDVPASAEQA